MGFTQTAVDLSQRPDKPTVGNEAKLSDQLWRWCMNKKWRETYNLRLGADPQMLVNEPRQGVPCT